MLLGCTQFLFGTENANMYHRFWTIIPVLLVLALVLAACGQGSVSPTLQEQQEEQDETIQPEPAEEPMYVWNQLLGRDSILPIYDPEFVPAGEANYSDDELVMGVAIDGEAKAYLVALLNSREMVNDELAGIPILVTW
jgi:hypothetical protein